MVKLLWLAVFLVFGVYGQEQGKYVVSDAEGREIARAEATFWRLQWGLQQASLRLEGLKDQVRRKCEGAEGVYVESQTQDGNLDLRCEYREVENEKPVGGVGPGN